MPRPRVDIMFMCCQCKQTTQAKRPDYARRQMNKQRPLFCGKKCAAIWRAQRGVNKRGPNRPKIAAGVALLFGLMGGVGKAEHLPTLEWMKGHTGAKGQSCCGVLDCTETTVALLEHGDLESTVLVGDTVLTLPTLWVHPSEDSRGHWCFFVQPAQAGQPGAWVDADGRTRAIPPEKPTREATRCVFYRSTN